MKRSLSVLCLSILFIYSCGPGKKISKTHEYTSLDTITVSAANDMYRSSATREWDITHTRVSLTFNWKEKTADGRAWIKIHPYCYATDTLVLDAKDMQFDSVALQTGNTFSPLTYKYKDDKLTIKYNKTYHANDTILLYIKYKALPYASESGGSAAITDDRGLYFINTDYSVANKPSQIWTQGETESNSHWLPTIDKPNERFTTQVELTVPDTMQTLSNGYLSRQYPIDNHLRVDIWKMDMPIQTYAIMFAIGRFSIIEDHWKEKEVNYYVESQYAPYASKIFNNTPEMMSFYSSITGVRYPWNKYDQIVVRDYVSGAMENTSASLFGEFVNQNAREIIDHNYEDVVAHELFHQWFGDYVTAESWSNITLNESFANYSEQLWRRYKYGKASADKLAFDDLQKYLSNTENADPALVRYFYADKENVFDRISYEKGGAVLRYLHGLIGDTAFYKAMNIYLTKNALQPAEVSQWRTAVEEATGKDWNWFFNQWYFRAGHPVLDVNYQYDDVKQLLTVTVLQKQQDSTYRYKLPLKAAVIYDEPELVDWNITRRKEVYTYPYRNGKKPVIVPDAMHWLVGVLQDNKPMKYLSTQYRYDADDYINKRVILNAAAVKMGDTASQTIIKWAIADRLPAIREYALAILGLQDAAGTQQKWEHDVKEIAVNDDNNNVRASAFYALGEWKVFSAKQDMINALSDSSYEVAGRALGALAKLDSLQAYNQAKRLFNSDPQALLQSTIWYIVSKQSNDMDITFFEQKWPYVYGGEKMTFDASLQTYEQRVKSDAAFEKGLYIMTQLSATEQIKKYRKYLGYFLVELAEYYKEDKKAPNATVRLPLIKQSIQQLIGTETDKELLARYKEVVK